MRLFKYPFLAFIYLLFFPLFLIAEEAVNDEFYILPDFVVTDDEDKGYYSR